ncbi:MAG: LegC family aminotransferase [Pseudohongiellaceae bacterium]
MDVTNWNLTVEKLIAVIRDTYGEETTPLHRPVFEGNERRRLIDCIDSNFVSSAGKQVGEFEQRIAEFTGARYAIATVNGTAALHIALKLAGVLPGDEVITQALTFVATCNAITYAGASPLFIDVDRDTMSLSPMALEQWLSANTVTRHGAAFNLHTGARISACLPMHTFGIPGRIRELVKVCERYGIPLVEDAAESLGSYVDGRHTGTFGALGTFSFNGNKIITTGGGGMIVTNDEELATRARHLTTTAKVPHAWEFIHDEIGYNYRLPNLNATLGCAQMEKLPVMLEIKREIAARYHAFCEAHGLEFVTAREEAQPNHWLNAIVLEGRAQRDAFLAHSNEQGIMTRPIWQLMSELPMFAECEHDGLENSRWLQDRVVNLPSAVPEKEFWRLRE